MTEGPADVLRRIVLPKHTLYVVVEAGNTKKWLTAPLVWAAAETKRIELNKAHVTGQNPKDSW